MNIKINNTADAKADAETILSCGNSFDSLVTTMKAVMKSITDNWYDCKAKQSAITGLTNSINYYETKIIPALNKLGTSINAYAIATEQLAAATAGGGSFSPLSADGESTNYSNPSEYADSQKSNVVLDGYTAPSSIENISELEPGEIDAYLYNKAMDMGMTDEQAKIAITIARTETGDYTSNRMVNDFNWGGIKGSPDEAAGITVDGSRFRHYSSAEQGAGDFLSVLKHCYDQGCDTLAELQPSYCPDTDANGYSHWLSTTQAIYNERFVANTRVMER